jgi:uncharacterized membrane protein YdjX (TVP38/TMEM64 family)
VTKGRWAVLLAIAAGVAAFFIFDLGQYLSLAYFKERQAEFTTFYEAHRPATVAAFFLAYVAVTGLSLPGAAIMTLAAGAIFGLVWGTLIVSFASSLGATLAMLAARFLLRDAIQSRYRDRLKTVNDGMRKDGPYYLFTLRLIPLVPFFVVNLVMGLTSIRAWTFYWVSQVGMLAGTLVFVNAGTQLAKIESTGDLLSPVLIGSFVLLGLFPLIAKKIMEKINARRRKAS